MKKQRRENGAMPPRFRIVRQAFPGIASLLPVAREFLTRARNLAATRAGRAASFHQVDP